MEPWGKVQQLCGDCFIGYILIKKLDMPVGGFHASEQDKQIWD